MDPKHSLGTAFANGLAITILGFFLFLLFGRKVIGAWVDFLRSVGFK